MKVPNITLSGNEKIGLISNMTTMLTAGIPILDTVDSLLEDAKGNQKKLLETLRADLMQGQHVYFAFSKFPRIFDKVTVNIIKASEEAGSLDVTLRDLKDNIKKDMEFSDRVKSAMIYPVFILIVLIAVLTMILIVVVPKISTVFSRLNVTLPLPTKIMIYASDLLLKNTIPVLLVIVVITSGVFFLYQRYRRTFLNFLFHFPLISKLSREIDLTRFSRSLYLLLNAGIPITSALELTQEVVNKKEVLKAIISAKQAVVSGRKLSDGLKEHKKVIPNIMIKITEAGEKSGSLDKSMQDTSEFLDYQVSNTLKTLTVLIEPLMLVLVGVLVGGMMLSIIAPIYGLIGSIGNR